MPGPIPKRTDQVRRPNRKDRPGMQIASGGGAVTVPKPDENWHPVARQLWDALEESGQSQFYESSDWAFAFSLMDDLSYYKRANKRSGQMLQSIYSAMDRLLITEGDRRRARLQLERHSEAPAEDPRVAIMDRYRHAAQ